MVRYWYARTPLLVLGTVVLLSIPWLGVLAVMVVALAALAALAAAVRVTVSVMSTLARTMTRPWHAPSGAYARTTASVRVSETNHAYALEQTGNYASPHVRHSSDSNSFRRRP
jgi:hypothetical protein